MLQNSNSHSARMSSSSQQKKQRPTPVKGYIFRFDNTQSYSLPMCIEQSVAVLNKLEDDIKWKFNDGKIISTRDEVTSTFEIATATEHENINFEIALVFVQSIVDILTHFYISDKSTQDRSNVKTQINTLIEKVFGKKKRWQDRKREGEKAKEQELAQANAKMAQEHEQARVRSENEQARVRAEKEQARVRAENEQARVRAEKEQARVRVEHEQEQARVREQEQKQAQLYKTRKNDELKKQSELVTKLAKLDDSRDRCSKQQILFNTQNNLTSNEIEAIITNYTTKYDWMKDKNISNISNISNTSNTPDQYNGILIMMVLYNLMMNQPHIEIIMSLTKDKRDTLLNGDLVVYKKYLYYDYESNKTNLQFVTELYFNLNCTTGRQCDITTIDNSCNSFKTWLNTLDKSIFINCFSDDIIPKELANYVTQPKLLTYIRFRGDEYGNMSNSDKFEKKIENNSKYLFIKLNYMLNTYVSGPFTNIFFEEDSNDDVANKCTEILKLLNNKESVFVVGYGSSGAGKTSTLINYRYKDSKGDRQSEHGILLNIIKKIDNVSTVTMEIFEDYYGTFKNVTTELQKQLTFQRKSSNADYTLSKGSILNTENIPNKLGECIIFFIDEPKRRRIAATTNNKQSSRSHVIVKLTFTFNNTSGIGTGTAIMYIADYAGVENIFQCNDVGELVKFANIKSNRVNDDSFFYDKEANNEDMQICNKNGSSYNITKNVKNEEVILPSKRADIDKKIVNNSIWENYTTNCFLNPFDYNKENTKLDVFNKNIDEFIHKQSTIETNAIQIENKNQVRQTYYESSQADLSTFVNELKNINTNYFKVSSSETNTYHIYYNLAHTPFVNTSSTVKDELVQIQVINDYHNALIKKYPPLYSYEVNKVEITIESNKKYSYMKLKNRSVTIKNNNVEITFKSDGTKFIPIDARGAKRLASYYNISYRNTTNSVIEFREIYSTFEINVIPFKEIHVQLSNNTKIDNEWKKKSEALKSLYNYYKYCTQRLQDIKGVCKCRAGEGIHINNSIEKMRNHIFKLLSGDRNNFSKTLTYSRCTSGLLPPLVINPIKETPSSEDDDDVKNAMRMAVGDDKVNVVVFGIFNNSPEQDIKTLYVDINNLKYWYYCYCITDIYKLRKEIIPNVLKGILKDYSDETTILKNIKQEIDKIKGMGKELNTYQKKILKNIKDFIAQYDRKNTLSLENVKNIIEMIQRENNTSPIGTLEFMDHMSKMNPEIMPFCNTDQDVIDYDNILKKKGVNNRVQ